jgi:hypothetical protein
MYDQGWVEDLEYPPDLMYDRRGDNMVESPGHIRQTQHPSRIRD